MPMRRGEVWWAELPQPSGNRPAVILTRNEVVNSIGGVVVALVTTTRRGLPTEVNLGKKEGLRVPSVVSLDNLLTVPRHSLKRLLGACDKDRLGEVDRALKFALGLT